MNSKATLLVTGGTGFIGGHLALRSPFPKTWVTWHSHPICQSSLYTAVQLNLTDRADVRKTVTELHPDIIIHTAALASLAICRERPDEAWAINVDGSAYLAEAAHAIGARLILLSTDLVFDGERGNYDETATPRPLSIYARTKLEAERIVSRECPNACIVRGSLVYGFSANDKHCFTEVLLQRLREGELVKLYTDEYRTPIYIEDFCSMLFKLGERQDMQHVVHLGGPERVSRYRFGLMLCNVFNLDTRLVIPISADKDSTAGERPKDCSLNSDKLYRELNFHPQPIRDSLHAMRMSEHQLP